MVAVEEFELAAGEAAAEPPQALRRRRAGEPRLWVGIAVASIVLGVITVPPTLPRAAAGFPEWGGLGTFVYATIDPRFEDEPLALARDMLAGMSVSDDEGRVIGAVVILISEQPAAVDNSADLAVGLTEALASLVDRDHVLTALESTDLQTDWLCEPASGHATCTALDDPGVALVIDWPTG